MPKARHYIMLGMCSVAF